MLCRTRVEMKKDQELILCMDLCHLKMINLNSKILNRMGSIRNRQSSNSLEEVDVVEKILKIIEF